MNVLFIDNTVQDYELFVTSVNENTFPIVYSTTSTKEEILALLNTFTKIDRIGFVFSSILAKFLDKPFTDNVDFFISVIQDFHLKNIDYLACNTLNYPEWVDYYTLLSATGVIIGASNDLTGNIKYGGDWVMESTSEDIEFIYFTKSIEYYSYLLDSSSNHTIIIKNDGLYGTGYNIDGQLGLGNITTPITTLTSIDTDNKTPKYISCGVRHTIVLMTDGTLYGTGYNLYGQLGLGNINTPITILTSINTYGKTPKYISCGGYHTIVLMTDGTLYGTGRNAEGQLGLGNINTPITILTSIDTDNKTPKYISCGFNHTIVLMTDGTLYGTGYNIDGQLGLDNMDTPITILTSIDTDNKTPKYISGGFRHTIVLMTDGTLYGTGRNAEGQLGLDNTNTPITILTFIDTYGKTPNYISCGYNHTIVLMTDGTLYGTGYNLYGQLGLGNINTPITILTYMLNATNVTYVAGMISEDIPSSNICFPAGTPVQTDQGIISIENIHPFIHTIGMKPIVDITKTVSRDKYLVGFKKNALGLNYPTNNTLISKEHKILYKGKLREAKYFLDKFENVVKVKYNGEVLYNVLMEEHSQMSVNQLICETLHPNNIIAKLYTNQFKHSDEVRDKISITLKKCIRRKDYKTYNKIINHC